MTAPAEPFTATAGRPRKLDLRYANRPVHRDQPHYFPFVVDTAQPWLLSHDAGTIVELGCAGGAFAHYLLSRFPAADFTGVDIHPALVEAAQARVPGARFVTGDVLKLASLPDGPFDTVFMVALHSHFDDPAQWIDALLRLLAPGGRAYVFGLFNPEPVDVLVRLREAGDDGEWLPGWNQFSRRTVSAHLDGRSLRHRYLPYAPASSRDRTPDPLRSHTVTDPYQPNGLVFVNGSQMLHRFALLEVERP
jgi:SAM-dependent methyltransferase